MQHEKKLILDYAQKAYAQKLVAGTSGNLSIKTTTGHIFITPSGLAYDEMTIDDIVVIDIDGNILDGQHNPSSEWPMHAEIYKSMPEVGAIVHTHSPYATAFSALAEDIPVFLVEMVYFLPGGIPVAPIALQGSTDLGKILAQTLQNRGGCLMQNHGAVSIGKDIAEAYLRTEYIEEAAKIYHIAKTIGTPNIIPDDLVAQMLTPCRGEHCSPATE